MKKIKWGIHLNNVNRWRGGGGQCIETQKGNEFRSQSHTKTKRCETLGGFVETGEG